MGDAFTTSISDIGKCKTIEICNHNFFLCMYVGGYFVYISCGFLFLSFLVVVSVSIIIIYLAFAFLKSLILHDANEQTAVLLHKPL